MGHQGAIAFTLSLRTHQCTGTKERPCEKSKKTHGHGQQCGDSRWKEGLRGLNSKVKKYNNI